MAKTIKMLVPLVGISKGERKPTIDAEGFVGEGCRTATEAFQRAIGTTEDETVKPEMYQTEEPREHLNL